MTSVPSCSAVILTGGASRRMGGRDKGLLELDGRPMIDYALGCARRLTDQIILSANAGADRYARWTYPVLADDTDLPPGPLAGVLTALRRIRTPWLAVLPCDVPGLPEDVMLRLARRIGPEPLVVAHDGERQQHLILLVRADLASDLETALHAGTLRVQDFIAAHRHAVVTFAEGPAAFRNLNAPGDVSDFLAGRGAP